VDGQAASARFFYPLGVAAGPDGAIYVADGTGHRVRKLAPGGTVSTLAGTGVAGFADGPGAKAQFNLPYGIAVDAAGTVYLAEAYGHRIRQIAPDGTTKTLAGDGVAGFAEGTGTGARFNLPCDVVADPSGNVFVADRYNARIRKIAPGGVVTTVAGGVSGSADGKGSVARFMEPIGLERDGQGNLYVSECTGNRIRRITPGGLVTTLAGPVAATGGAVDGTGPAARFSCPIALAWAGDGALAVVDYYNNRIRRVTLGGVTTTLAGTGVATSTDGAPLSATFKHPAGVTLDRRGGLVVSDSEGFTLRRLSSSVAACFDGVACTADACSAATGMCAYTPVAAGTACDDGNPCTTDACDGALGCTATAIPGCPQAGDGKWAAFSKNIGYKDPYTYTPTLADYGTPVTAVADTTALLPAVPDNTVIGLRTWAWVPTWSAFAACLYKDDGTSVWVNDVLVSAAGYNYGACQSVSFALVPGWNKVEIAHYNGPGPGNLSIDVKLGDRVFGLRSVKP